MSEHFHEATHDSGGDDVAIVSLLAGIGQLLMPFARMYLGPSAAVIERDERDVSAGERRLLMFALHKLIVETGTLPAPGAAYEPHSATWSVDERGHAPALDLKFLLAAARALAAWASAGPTTAPPSEPQNRNEPDAAHVHEGQPTAAPMVMAPMTTRALRTAARARGYAGGATRPVAAARSTGGGGGGCGCRGARGYAATGYAPSAYGSSYSTSSVAMYAKPSRKQTRRPASDCHDPVPHCDCDNTCGGRGCGCAGMESCTDCIPRGARATDLCSPGCSCGTCKKPPEKCDPWTPSCETRNRLRKCLKDLLCELLECVEKYLCADGRFDPASLRKRRPEFYRCLFELLCKLLRCIREALCPPPEPPKLPCPPPVDCLPCSYAVEEPR